MDIDIDKVGFILLFPYNMIEDINHQLLEQFLRLNRIALLFFPFSKGGEYLMLMVFFFFALQS